MARFYKLDPSAVGAWPMPDYSDRQEYMFVSQELDRLERVNSENG